MPPNDGRPTATRCVPSLRASGPRSGLVARA
eukprot:CAMPEP_0204280626 /NCGR_PEP_ID=MMETSP0468-20130131/38718_1 /ASSEMBLY_ACC=CAM_ASM_000383 /TAXON_ID=2969 /ORGANISM="Oxyrrhis marina" /LENGTH=30 /DNA_ID= /DNA_START= /DNA_END= /DNA_ORIENTATION=